MPSAPASTYIAPMIEGKGDSPAGHRGNLRRRLGPRAVVVGTLLAVVTIRISLLYEPYTFLIGDCPYYAQTAISVLFDGDLDLHNQLGGRPHSRQMALGARGEWYPKHPILMPLVTIPFLPLLKMNGFLVFNVLVLICLGVALYELGRLVCGKAAAAGGALAMILGSFLIRYDYNYSPDLFACLLLTLAVIEIVKGRSWAAGLLGGFAALARTSNLLLLPVLLGYVLWRWKLRAALVFAAVAGLPLLGQAALNQWMFGSPFVSSYMRIVAIEDGKQVLLSHMSDFDNPLWSGIRGQLLDPDKGLLFTAPVLLLALPGYVVWFGRRRDQAILCLAMGEFVFLLFSRYRWWPTSHHGNRFLMPLLALSTPAVACAIDWALLRLGRRGEAPFLPPAG